MALPWFPFNVKAYVTDTMRLSTEGHGAYLLLMLDYYSTGTAPPDDDNVLAAITKLPVKTWRIHRKNIEPFFWIIHGRWVHPRIEHEMFEAASKHAVSIAKAKAAAGARWGKKTPKNAPGNAPSNAPSIPDASPRQSLEDAHKQEQGQDIGGGGEAPPPEPVKRSDSKISDEAFALSTEVLVLMGLHPEHPLSVGSPMQVQSWLNGGWPRDAIIGGVQQVMLRKRGDPPSTLRYFEKAIARAHAEFTRPLPVAVINDKPEIINANGKTQRYGGSLNAVLDAAIARERARLQDAGYLARDEDPVLVLPSRSVR
jgi:uncharacterized protein YdaU (DUF1376 family)